PCTRFRCLSTTSRSACSCKRGGIRRLATHRGRPARAGGVWRARHLDPDVHSPGERNTQKIERKHLTFWTRIKRLVRKTICFSKSILMHDLVIGLFINRYEFGYGV